MLANEVDEMLTRIDEKFKYNLLRANYMVLAQSYHNILSLHGEHDSSNDLTISFAKCTHPTCIELARTLELTRI